MSIAGRGRFNIVVTDEYGNIAPGGSVEIRTEPGLALTDLFTNRNGTGARANPLTADENGYAFAYAATGHYQIKVSVYGRERILRDVEIGRATTVDATATSFSDTLYVVAPNVGIGVNTPQGNLHIRKSNTGATADTGANALVLEATATTGLSILSSNTQIGRMYFGDPENASIGRILYDHAGNSLRMWTNNGERLRIDLSGNIGVGTTSPSTKLHVNGPIRHLTYTVATLPAAGTVGAGTRAAVTNANATTFNSIVAGGGSNFVPVISNGTNWRIG